jgi:hypothetical protein
VPYPLNKNLQKTMLHATKYINSCANDRKIEMAYQYPEQILGITPQKDRTHQQKKRALSVTSSSKQKSPIKYAI